MNASERILAGLALATTLLALGSCVDETPTGLPSSGDRVGFELVITVQPAGISLAWPAATDPDFLTYQVYRSVPAATALSPLATTTGTTWLDTTAAERVTYFYQVAVVNRDGNEIARSRIVAILTHPAASFLLNGGAAYTAQNSVAVSLTAEDCVSALIWNGAAGDSTVGIEHALVDGALSLADWELPGGEGGKNVWAKLRYEIGADAPGGKTTLTSVTYQNRIVVDWTPPDGLPELIGPADGEITHLYKVSLEWTAGSDLLCPDLSYDVYLWVDTEPEQLVYSGPTPRCHVSGLEFGAPCHWRVVVSDGAGNTTAGPTWSFTASDELVAIAPGTFVMGSPYGTPGRKPNETQHEVTLSRGFYIAPYEVTAELWDDVMGAGSSTSQLPKVNVSWDDAIRFCNALSGKRGFDPAYTWYGPGQVTWNPAANGYRLLTEAEWEYACRAGSQTSFTNGDLTDVACDDPLLDEVGRYCGNSLNGVGPVGGLLPNAWNIHDMHGNVWEWCWDLYFGDHTSAPVTDPVNGGYEQDDNTTYRLIRGGNFRNNAVNCRSSERASFSPSGSGYGLGFRIARRAE